MSNLFKTAQYVKTIDENTKRSQIKVINKHPVVTQTVKLH